MHKKNPNYGKNGKRKGAWSKEEDDKLKRAVEELGDKNWKYPFTKHEEDFIFHLHAQYGNAWSRIASKLPGRSDNDIKNFWHKKSKKQQRQDKKQNHQTTMPAPSNQSLKQKLRERGISTNQHSFIKAPEETHLFTAQVPFHDNSTGTKDGIQHLKASSTTILHKTEKSESGECMHSEMSTHAEYSDSKEEDLIGEIFNSETFLDHNYHVNTQCNVIASNCNLCNECPLQDSFGERSPQIDEPFSPKSHSDALGAVNSPTSTTILHKPGDGSGSGQLSYGVEYFQCSLEQELSDGLDIRFPERNLGAESLPVHQNTAVDLVDSSNLVSQPTAVRESLGCHHFSLQKHSAPTNFCQSSFIQNQYHEAHHCSSLDGLYGEMIEQKMGEET
ncbi:MYB-related transcription factor [Salvia divinorum]|uniref:MYB-related transcription factor n=1 Tax=Salvia divinorum TaxID=28513 RepID=A0ABD1IGW9_SALDI